MTAWQSQPTDAVQLLGKARSPAGKTHASYLARWLGGEGASDPKEARSFAWGCHDRAALESALQNNPDDGPAHFALGCLLAEGGQLPAALDHLAKAAGICPSDHVVRTTLGILHLQLGRPLRRFDAQTLYAAGCIIERIGDSDAEQIVSIWWRLCRYSPLGRQGLAQVAKLRTLCPVNNQ